MNILIVLKLLLYVTNSAMGAHEILVHGHRGSRGTHPENSIPAFQEALEARVDVLELDLQLSLDDIPVISHDSEINEMCRDLEGKIVKKPIPIRLLTGAQISTFECGTIRNPKFPKQKLISTHIPTLEEFLEWVIHQSDTVQFNIETKMTASKEEHVPPPELFAEKVAELLTRFRVVDRTIVQSFDFRTLQAIRKLIPELRLSCLFETESNFCELTKRVGAEVASPLFELLTEENVRECHTNNIQVVPWTVNEQNDWIRMIQFGVDAIITDFPRLLREYIDRI